MSRSLCTFAVALLFVVPAVAQERPSHPRLRAALQELRDARKHLMEAKDAWPAGYKERALASTQAGINSIRTILAVKSVDDFTGVDRGPDYYNQFVDHPRLRAALKDLREARAELVASKTDFKGKREEAIDDIDVAIGDILTLIRHKRR